MLVALDRSRARSPEELVLEVYADVPSHLQRVALRSLTAHLDKLVAEGRVRAVEGRYVLA